jgi:hypothetical protein
MYCSEATLGKNESQLGFSIEGGPQLADWWIPAIVQHEEHTGRLGGMVINNEIQAFVQARAGETVSFIPVLC